MFRLLDMAKMGDNKYMTASWNEELAKAIVTEGTSTVSEGLMRQLIESYKWLAAFKAKAITAQDLKQKLSANLFFITLLTVISPSIDLYFSRIAPWVSLVTFIPEIEVRPCKLLSF